MTEFFVIVTGVLAAFAVDAWWDDRQRAGKELELLVSLSEEFEANAAEMARTESSHRRLLNAALALLEAADSVVGSRTDVWTGPYVMLVQDSRTDLNSGGLEGYLELADPGLITDPELRAALAAWPARLGELAREEERSTRLIDTQILPFLSRQADVRVTFRLGVFTEFEEERVRRQWSEADRDGVNDRVRDDRALRNLAAWKVRVQRDILNKHRNAVEHHERVRELLAAAIDARR